MSLSHYAERPPTPELAGYVESLWHQQVAAGSGQYGQRVLPDGCVDALWRDGLLCVAGPDTAWRMVDIPANSSIVGVRFRPGAAKVLFGAMPASEACSQQIDLSELWGAGPVVELGERMAAAESPWAKAELLQDAVLQRLRQVGRLDPVVQAAVHEMDRPQPDPVPVMADRFGLSERQFRRRFVAAVGYGPKVLEGVFRLHRAIQGYLAAAQAGHPVGAAEVAVTVGYADQPHLVREMRRLAGITPSELIRPVAELAPA
jgi:AraC-like DNA-binding protein